MSVFSKEIIPKKYRILAVLMITAIAVLVVWLVTPPPPREIDFSKYEKSVFSQNGEDGVLEIIFKMIKPTHRYAVEFGAADGIRNSNTRNLFINHGWSGLLIEGDEKLANTAVKHYQGLPRVKAIHAWVYPGNIEILLEENGVPKELDLISIDIDSNDYYVWRVIHNFRPKVVLIEFNPFFPPPAKVVVDFHPMNYWDGSDYFGASIQSFYELGKKKGYELVYCESAAINLFFVDKKYYHRFGIKDNSPAKLYRPPRHGRSGRLFNKRGWPVFDPRNVYGKDGKRQELTWKDLRIKKRLIHGR
jgi:hypothetical protein